LVEVPPSGVTGTLALVAIMSPAKLLVILVVALIVLGPDKLPKVAKQIGGLWADFQKFRHKLETDVRGSFPDLPSTESISQAIRSPLSVLDKLADAHTAGNVAPTPTPPPASEPPLVSEPPPASEPPPVQDGGAPLVPDIPDIPVPPLGGGLHQIRAVGDPDDPGMN
jgi:sec-independent protein translocase protein TatB